MRSGATWAFFVAPKGVGVSMVLIALFGCSGSDDAEAEPTTDLRYCDVQPIFEEKCVRCHQEDGDVSGAPALDEYELVRARAGSIKSAITRGGATGMPPVGVDAYDVDPPVEPLTDEELDLLVEWTTGGAPEGDPASCD